jgi:hypothetical protein
VAAVFLVYIGSYVILSARGNWYWSQTGKLRYSFRLAVTDVERWQPAWARWEPFRDINGDDTSRGNLQGFFYSPLIRLNRAWVHRDRLIFMRATTTKSQR